MPKENLKLVIVHNASANEYSLAAHNQTPEEADTVIREWNQHLIEGCTLIALDQSVRHKTQNAEHCRACRETVTRSAHPQPQPKFARRKS